MKAGIEVGFVERNFRLNGFTLEGALVVWLQVLVELFTKGLAVVHSC